MWIIWSDRTELRKGSTMMLMLVNTFLTENYLLSRVLHDTM